MPSRKILVVLIICIGAVISIWLFTRTGEYSSNIAVKKNPENVIVTAPIDQKTNEDWKKILKTVSANETVIKVNTNETYDSTTLTAQMSQDFMSQYLFLKRGGREVSSEDAQKIAQNVLSMPQYSEKTGATYIQSNLHVTSKNDKQTIEDYKLTVNYSLKNRSSKIQEGPVTIMTTAVASENYAYLEKLDPIIVATRGFVSDFLSIEVPSSAVNIHLDLLNTASRLLSNLESMRVTLNDPVRAMFGIGQYNQNITDFTLALKNINTYFIQKTGSQY